MYTHKMQGWVVVVLLLFSFSVQAETDSHVPDYAVRPLNQKDLEKLVKQLTQDLCEMPKPLPPGGFGNLPLVPKNQVKPKSKDEENLIESLELTQLLIRKMRKNGNKDEDLKQVLFHLERYLNRTQPSGAGESFAPPPYPGADIQPYAPEPPSRKARLLNEISRDLNEIQILYPKIDRAVIKNFKNNPSDKTFKALQWQLKKYPETRRLNDRLINKFLQFLSSN